MQSFSKKRRIPKAFSPSKGLRFARPSLSTSMCRPGASWTRRREREKEEEGSTRAEGGSPAAASKNSSSSQPRKTALPNEPFPLKREYEFTLSRFLFDSPFSYILSVHRVFLSFLFFFFFLTNFNPSTIDEISLLSKSAKSQVISRISTLEPKFPIIVGLLSTRWREKKNLLRSSLFLIWFLVNVKIYESNFRIENSFTPKTISLKQKCSLIVITKLSFVHK